ncbi:chorismate mutase [Xylariales sp. AK1849]|nr:chorismate mutase [Xylariales sp. AK1849]
MADAAIDLSDASKALDLANIRYQLIRLEDTIIFHLIERVQFPLNKTIYTPGAVEIGEEPNLSFMDWYLREQEKLQALIRRYESPDEYPFFPEAKEVKPVLKRLNYPSILHPHNVNVNENIKKYYVEKFLPKVCTNREDRGESAENYGSTATCDIACLQAISRRIHFGKFVAESKFQSDKEKYTKLIKAEDREAIGDSITNAAVEKQVLARLALKARTYGKDLSTNGDDTKSKIDVDKVVSMYENFVIPITKEVEVEYLMQRLG